MNTLICLLAAGVGNPPPAPLHCPAPVAAKGAVRGGPALAHTFELSHRGAAGTVTITAVEAGCGCLRQALGAGVLRPGEATNLTLEVNTLTQPDGPNRWQVVVGYRVDVPGEQPRPGELLLQITADLSREVAVSPPQLAFSTAGAAAQTLTLTDSRASPLRVVKAAASSPHLTTEIGPAGKPGTQTVTVRVAADAPVGHRDEVVVLLTDDPAYPELRVPVRVLKRAAGAVTAAPEAVVLRLPAGETEASALVQLRSPDGKPVAVSGVEADHPAVTARWSPGSGPVATVRVTATTSPANRTGTAKVRVKLAEPAGQEVVVPVSWSAAKGG
jgi:hypothetical protein